MGLLKFFYRSGAAVQKLPSGSFTVDRDGNIVTTTVASSYPRELLEDVAKEILRLFRDSRAAQISVNELTLHFASFQITARELRGGAIVFLSPKTTSSPN
jgi:hypothetical protein